MGGKREPGQGDGTGVGQKESPQSGLARLQPQENRVGISKDHLYSQRSGRGG